MSRASRPAKRPERRGGSGYYYIPPSRRNRSEAASRAGNEPPASSRPKPDGETATTQKTESRRRAVISFPDHRGTKQGLQQLQRRALDELMAWATCPFPMHILEATEAVAVVVLPQGGIEADVADDISTFLAWLVDTQDRSDSDAGLVANACFHNGASCRGSSVDAKAFRRLVHHAAQTHTALQSWSTGLGAERRVRVSRARGGGEGRGGEGRG